MLEKKGPNLLHWNYFLALESDLKHLSRYIEFTEENHKTYSLELAHLLLAAASEVDVVLKGLCKKIRPESEPKNINEYREIVEPQFPKLSEMKIRIPRYGLEIVPWENWKCGASPNWWRAYNEVKHERDKFFSQATLQHTIAAVAGLFVVLLYYYKSEAECGELLPSTEILSPQKECIIGVGPSNFGNSVVYRLEK